MKKIVSLVLFASLTLTLAQAQLAQQTCASSNKSTPAINRLQPAGTAEHVQGGLHSWGVTPVFGCIYSHSNTANCDTECTVTSLGSSSANPIGFTTIVETGALTAVGTHLVSGSWNPGDAKGFNAGASCSGTVAGAAANCFTVGGACFVSVTFSVGVLTVSTNGTKVWDSGPVPASGSCPTVADPQATPTPTPAPTPLPTPVPLPTPLCDPCVGCLIVGGPVGDFNHPDCSPIIIDLTGNGFALTSAQNGVMFDIANTGTPLQIAWTANANNAFLALDRNGNGVINSGAELFGNFTAQPASAHPNGFAALAVYDDPANGGNGDGVIDAKDKIFSSLRLWVDANHDGICQPNELHTLPEMGIYSISLDYSLSERTDQYGNVFRYKARVNKGLNGPADVGKTAYDVFLVAK